MIEEKDLIEYATIFTLGAFKIPNMAGTPIVRMEIGMARWQVRAQDTTDKSYSMFLNASGEWAAEYEMNPSHLFAKRGEALAALNAYLDASPVTYYFTFGAGQTHEGKYHKITVPNKTGSGYDARNLMNVRFGLKWSMQYDSPKAAGIEEFGLVELK